MEKEKKTVTMNFESIKDSDAWMELAYDLKFDEFKNKYPEMNDNDLSDKFYEEVVPYGEYGSFEIIVDENFNIVGGKIK